MDRAPVPPRVPKWVGEGKSEEGRWLRALMSISLSTVATHIHMILLYVRLQATLTLKSQIVNVAMGHGRPVFHLLTNPPPSNTTTTGCITSLENSIDKKMDVPFISDLSCAVHIFSMYSPKGEHKVKTSSNKINS